MTTKNSEEKLSKKQEDFFEQLKELYQNRALPSLERLRVQFEYKSRNSIKQYLNVLEENGFLKKLDGNYYINSSLGAPLASSFVRAGFAGVMEDKIEKRISMDEILNINAPSTFVFKVSGDSMQDIGILDGDFVVIKKQQSANIGDIVLAVIDNEFTLKTYKKDKLGYYLKPENSDYPLLRPKFSLSIFGVALGVVRKF